MSLLKIKEHICTMCESGYGKNNIGKCEKCGDGCDYCQHDHTRCISCVNGKILDSASGKCEAPPISNCNSVDSVDKSVCRHCMSGFYLGNENGKSECVSCSKFDENCMYCKGPDERKVTFTKMPHFPVFDLIKDFRLGLRTDPDNKSRILQEVPTHV